jgi:hypothetical protein
MTGEAFLVALTKAGRSKVELMKPEIKRFVSRLRRDCQEKTFQKILDTIFKNLDNVNACKRKARRVKPPAGPGTKPSPS